MPEKDWKPLSNKVIVARVEAKKVTDGGIILPEGAEQTAARGKVLAVGPGRMLPCGTREPMTVKAGDEVVFCEHAGVEETMPSGQTVTVMTEDDLILFR